MSDEELCKGLRLLCFIPTTQAADRIEALTAELTLAEQRGYANAMEAERKLHEDRIEALTEQLEAARADAKEAEAYAEELEAMNKNQEAMIRQADRRGDALEAKLAKSVEALRKLHHAVCGETGFAACVRLDSGLAYPWPALDEADEMTRATLAEIEGEKG
jgi:septal ring factor EnvC (AmiA/AmiB activator)